MCVVDIHSGTLGWLAQSVVCWEFVVWGRVLAGVYFLFRGFVLGGVRGLFGGVQGSLRMVQLRDASAWPRWWECDRRK